MARKRKNRQGKPETVSASKGGASQSSGAHSRIIGNVRNYFVTSARSSKVFAKANRSDAAVNKQRAVDTIENRKVKYGDKAHSDQAMKQKNDKES